MPKISLSRRHWTMRICSPAVVAVSVVALANTVAAQPNRLPAQFLGCYVGAWGEHLECRQPTVEQRKAGSSCRGIVVDAKMWGTDEDWTCDRFSVEKRGDGIIVNQTCGGEGHYGRYREYWELHEVANMTLLIRTDAKSLKSKIFIRCQGN
jgi:hypothetical protein